MENLTYPENNVTLLTYPDKNVTLCLDGTNSSTNTSVFAGMSEYMFDKTFNYGKFAFERCVTPIIYCVGIPGNFLSAYIWLQARMRQSSGIYLAALGIANLMFLTFHMFYYFMASWGSRVHHTAGWCELYSFLSMTFQYLSPILVLGFTVERYISVCHPFRREKLCTQNRAIITVVCMYCGAALINVIHTYFWQYRNAVCDVRPNVLVGEHKSFFSIWAWVTEMLIFLVIPLAVLCINVLVITEVKRMSRASVRIDGRKLEKTSVTTFTLLSVSFYLIFTTLPVSIMYAMMLQFPVGNPMLTCAEQVWLDPQWKRHLIFSLVRSIVNMIGMTQYACNLYIYVLTGKVFRRELATTCLGRCFGPRIGHRTDTYDVTQMSVIRRDTQDPLLSELGDQ